MNDWQEHLPLAKAALMLAALTLVVAIIGFAVPRPYAGPLTLAICLPSSAYIVFYTIRATIRIFRGS